MAKKTAGFGKRKPAPPKAPATSKRPARTAELANKVCALLADGMSLREIEKLPGMPTREFIRLWLCDDAEFVGQYTRAREDQAETLADEIVAIADRGDLKPDDRRVRVDARKWVAAKLKPKKYGDSTTLKGDADAPVAVTVIKSVL